MRVRARTRAYARECARARALALHRANFVEVCRILSNSVESVEFYRKREKGPFVTQIAYF